MYCGPGDLGGQLCLLNVVCTFNVRSGSCWCCCSCYIADDVPIIAGLFKVVLAMAKTRVLLLVFFIHYSLQGRFGSESIKHTRGENINAFLSDQAKQCAHFLYLYIIIIIMYTFVCHISIQDRAHGPLQAYNYIDIYIQ